MIDILRNSVMITGFVFVMMLVIEYLNVLTSGRWGERLAGNRAGQYVLAAVLGALPGCLGPFAIVAMFSHRIVGLGAVITAMIATSGDETFVMLALIPKQTLILIPALMATGIVAGMITDSLSLKVGFLENICCDGLVVHEEHEGGLLRGGSFIRQWRNCIPARGILTVAIVILLISVITGQFSHDHDLENLGGMKRQALESVEQGELSRVRDHEDEAVDGHAHDGSHEGQGKWGWIRVTLLVTSILALFIVATVPDHFLEEHLWKHIALRHVPRIFMWAFGALLVLHLLTSNLDIDLGRLVAKGQWFVLIAACLVGLIPESGPHLIFVTLFAGGYIPMSVLLASSIVQDGHGMLPVLAYSRRLFMLIKAINLIFGLAVGAAAMAAGL
jgi:hypothetical protein